MQHKTVSLSSAHYTFLSSLPYSIGKKKKERSKNSPTLSLFQVEQNWEYLHRQGLHLHTKGLIKDRLQTNAVSFPKDILGPVK